METEKSRAVLVTGSRGFIGRAVCNLLVREGYRVLALDQAETQEDAANPLRREIQCDISDAAQVQSIFEAEGIDTLVHLAAVLPTAAQADPQRATQVNIQGSLNLLQMASRFGVRRMVFGSSLSVYGSWPHDERVSETHRASPDDLYGAAKIYVEQLGAAHAASGRLEFVSLRMGAWSGREFVRPHPPGGVRFSKDYKRQLQWNCRCRLQARNESCCCMWKTLRECFCCCCVRRSLRI
jgi:nucleoside-diphosphate-sugar epimerase